MHPPQETVMNWNNLVRLSFRPQLSRVQINGLIPNLVFGFLWMGHTLLMLKSAVQYQLPVSMWEYQVRTTRAIHLLNSIFEFCVEFVNQ